MNIILSPHFDDAALSLGGLLAKEGKNSVVATFFAGAPVNPVTTKWDTACGFGNSSEAIRERTKEDTRSLASFGLTDERIRTYGHLDAQYRIPDRPKKGAYEKEPELETSITNEVVSLVREFQSRGPVTVYSPVVEVRAHDHHVVKDAARTAVRTLPPDSVNLYFYQDMPHVLGIMERLYPKTWWSRLTRKNEKDWNYALLERELTNDMPHVSRTVIPLSQDDMRKKIAGIGFYRSQINPLSEGLLERIERLNAAQARFFSVDAPYCEVVYKFDTRS